MNTFNGVELSEPIGRWVTEEHHRQIELDSCRVRLKAICRKRYLKKFIGLIERGSILNHHDKIAAYGCLTKLISCGIREITLISFIERHSVESLFNIEGIAYKRRVEE